MAEQGEQTENKIMNDRLKIDRTAIILSQSEQITERIKELEFSAEKLMDENNKLRKERDAEADGLTEMQKMNDKLKTAYQSLSQNSSCEISSLKIQNKYLEKRNEEAELCLKNANTLIAEGADEAQTIKEKLEKRVEELKRPELVDEKWRLQEKIDELQSLLSEAVELIETIKPCPTCENEVCAASKIFRKSKLFLVKIKK